MGITIPKDVRELKIAIGRDILSAMVAMSGIAPDDLHATNKAYDSSHIEAAERWQERDSLMFGQLAQFCDRAEQAFASGTDHALMSIMSDLMGSYRNVPQWLAHQPYHYLSSLMTQLPDAGDDLGNVLRIISAYSRGE